MSLNKIENRSCSLPESMLNTIMSYIYELNHISWKEEDAWKLKGCLEVILRLNNICKLKEQLLQRLDFGTNSNQAFLIKKFRYHYYAFLIRKTSSFKRVFFASLLSFYLFDFRFVCEAQIHSKHKYLYVM